MSFFVRYTCINKYKEQVHRFLHSNKQRSIRGGESVLLFQSFLHVQALVFTKNTTL